MGLIKRLLERLAGRQKVISALISPWGRGVEPWIQTAPSTDALLWRIAGNTYAAMSLIANCVADAATPHLFVVRKGQPQKTRKAYSRYIMPFDLDTAEEVFDHPALTLLQKINPSPLSGQFEFFSQVSLYMDAARYVGYIAKDAIGNPAELWTIPPSPLKPVFSEDGLIARWDYGQGSAQTTFETDEILLIRYAGAVTNLQDLVMGFPPLRAIARASDASNRLIEMLDTLLANRSVPDLHVTVKGGASQERRLRAREQWRETHGGTNLGDPLFTGEDTTVEPIGWTPKDAQYIESEKMIRELICNAFHVPVQLFTSESVPKANLEGALYQMAKFAIKPRLRLIADALNNTILPLFKRISRDQLIYAFEDPVPENHELINATVVTWSNSRIATLNERRTIAGLPEVEGGDEIPEDPVDAFADQDDDQQDQQDNRPPAKRSKAIDAATPGSKPKMRGLKGIIKEFFDDQKAAVIRTLEGSKGLHKTGFDALHFDFWSWIFKLNKAVYRPFLQRVKQGVREGRQILSMAGITGRFDLLDPNVIRFIEDRTQEFARRFATNVNEVTAEQLRSTLQEGIEAGEAIGDLKNRVNDVYTHASRARAEAIARTETKRASEAGKRISYEKSGVTQIEWFAGPDACPFCQRFDGKVVDILGGVYARRGETVTAEFTNEDGSTSERTMRLDFSDTPHPPLHPNCTCILLPVEETII